MSRGLGWQCLDVLPGSLSLTAATVGCSCRYVTSRGKGMSSSKHCFALFRALHLQPRSELALATGIPRSQEHRVTTAVWLCWGI